MKKESNIKNLKLYDFKKILNSIEIIGKNDNKIDKIEMFKEKDKILGVFPVNYSAKGKDLNKLCQWIQEEFKYTQNELIEYKKIFQSIYDCISSLDNDYIEAINLNSNEIRLISESGSKISDKSKQAIEKLYNEINKLKEMKSIENVEFKNLFLKKFIAKNGWIILIVLSIFTMFNFVVSVLFLIGAISNG